MRKNLKLKITLILIFFAGVAFAGYYFLLSPEPKQTKPSVALPDTGFGWKFPVTKFPLTGSTPGQLAYSDIRDPGGVPQGLPVRLKIPAIGVDTAIEDALITPDGRMDVPAGSKNVAWFSLGPQPGEEGSAVIGGHYGIRNGVPFVFYKLDNLIVGDKIYIVDDKDDTLGFVIRSIKLFDRDADATTVFTSQDGLAHLNLITCEGIWNQVDDTYPERRVIFADAIPVSGALAPATAAFHRSLGIGSEGADVEMLQTVLEQKGFLTMPAGVPKGYFGRITSSALSKYQTSVGLPSVGVFGPLTRAMLIADLRVSLELPNAGREEIDIPKDVARLIAPPPKSFIQSAKSLFETPIDGAITTSLLLSILFLCYKIIRRYKQ